MSDQLTRADLQRMTPDAVNAAVKAGQCAALIAGRSTPDPAPPGDADQGARGPDPTGRTLRQRLLEGRTPDEIVAMHRRGDLDVLMRGDA